MPPSTTRRSGPTRPAVPDERGAVRLFTIGHSTRDWAVFLGLLARHAIARLVDIRTMPGSRRYPHFDREAMEPALAAAGIDYEHAPALGGRRRARPGAPKTGWRNASFAGYADHMTTAEFRSGIDRLIDAASRQTTTIMCSEAVHWRCHRALVADALLARGVDVQHIMDAGLRPHSMTPFAQVVDGEVRYDAPDPQLMLAGVDASVAESRENKRSG